MKHQLQQCKNKLFADELIKGENFKGYEVYEPVYKKEYEGGFPKVVLVKEGNARISTPEECFEYLKFIKNKEAPCKKC